MPHVLILGMTTSGKTTLAKRLAIAYKKQRINVLVLDPLNDPGWSASYISRNKSEFLAEVKARRKCAVFVDESGLMIGRYADEMQWLATTARHWGHRCHFISQRAMQLDKTVRDQCEKVFLFRVSFNDAKLLSEEFADNDILQAAKLERFEYLVFSRFASPVRLKLAVERN